MVKFILNLCNNSKQPKLTENLHKCPALPAVRQRKIVLRHIGDCFKWVVLGELCSQTELTMKHSGNLVS